MLILKNNHLSSPPQPRDKRGTAGVNRAAICVSRFAVSVVKTH